MAKRQQQGNTYTVQAGDSWAKIAGKLYGNQRMFKELMAANPQLQFLKPGQKINLAMFKKNEDINISNNAAQALGMATTGEVRDFYAQNSDAQKYGMTNMLRNNMVALQPAAWNGTPDTQGYQDERYRATQAAQQAAMRGVYMPQPGNYRPAADANFQGANPYMDERYRATQGATKNATASGDKKYTAYQKDYFMPSRNASQGPQSTGPLDAFGRTLDRVFGGAPDFNRRNQSAGGQLPPGPFTGTNDPLGPQAAPFQPTQAPQQPRSQTGPLQVGMGPLGPTVGLSPQAMAGVGQAVGAANIAMGGQPPAGATVTNRPAQGTQQQPAAPVDPVKQAVTNIESGKATDRDYATISAAKLQSGGMTAQDWANLSKLYSPDVLKSAYATYNASFGLGGGATTGMDVMTGGIGNPSGIPQMQNNVFIGPNFDANKLRGYTNAKGTFVAANLAGSYFAPLKPNELAGYRSERNAGGLRESGGYNGSGLSTGLYSWRL